MPTCFQLWACFDSLLVFFLLLSQLVWDTGTQLSQPSISRQGGPCSPTGNLSECGIYVHEGMGTRPSPRLDGRRARTALLGSPFWPRAAATANCSQWSSWCLPHPSGFARGQGRLSHCRGSSTPPPVPFPPAMVDRKIHAPNTWVEHLCSQIQATYIPCRCQQSGGTWP